MIVLFSPAFAEMGGLYCLKLLISWRFEMDL